MSDHDHGRHSVTGVEGTSFCVYCEWLADRDPAMEDLLAEVERLRGALEDLKIALSDDLCDGWTAERIMEMPRLRAALRETEAE